MPQQKSAFWIYKRLQDMTAEEWESLCDGCAKCCLHKLEDGLSNEIIYTNVACRLLDLKSCRCSDYENRSTRVPDCVTLTAESVKESEWLPATCAYRLLYQGDALPWWHPLVSGEHATVVRSGNCVCGRVVSETEADDLESHLITWVR